MLGADGQGRDVAARLLYGGRNSLLIAGASTLICLVLAAIVGLVAGFFGGWVDWVLSRCLDVLWAFPVYLLAISLSIVLISHGIDIGPISINAGSLALPIFIIGIIFVPYVARPIRGQVLALKESEFVLAAVGLGVPAHRILFRDILPNVTTTLIVFVPLLMAINMVTESALSFLSIGVQPPDASWGTIIQDGQGLLYTRPMVALAPGIAIALTVLALNMFGDGVRDALDPALQAAHQEPPDAARADRPAAGPDAVRHVRHQRAGVPDLLCHARRRSCRPHRRPQRVAGDAAGRAPGFRPRSAAAGAIRA